MNIDGTLATEFICVVCLNQMNQPVMLQCGHSQCKQCLPVQIQDDGAGDGTLQHQCPHCGVLCNTYTHNHTLESVLTRFNWSSVVLSNARTNLALTQENEIKTRNMVVTSLS
jgi:hypothetical protein